MQYLSGSLDHLTSNLPLGAPITVQFFQVQSAAKPELSLQLKYFILLG